MVSSRSANNEQSERISGAHWVDRTYSGAMQCNTKDAGSTQAYAHTLMSTFSCARFVIASAARLATPPLPGTTLVTAVGLCALSSLTRPERAPALLIWPWYSGLTARRPRMKQASFLMSSNLTWELHSSVLRPC